MLLDKYFAAVEEYLGGIGHRTAALEDSRLLPFVTMRDRPPGLNGRPPAHLSLQV